MLFIEALSQGVKLICELFFIMRRGGPSVALHYFPHATGSIDPYVRKTDP